MSGHSKWHSIRHKKGLIDQKRGAIFTKLGRAITVAAKQGGGDPEMNSSLALAIQKAKAANMPKDPIQKAIDKGTGAGADSADFKEIVYEGYGPHGVAVMVQALTDNSNRTVHHVRHMFSKYGGNMGDSGAVSFLFEKKGIITLTLKKFDDDIEMALIESGADDYREIDDKTYLVTTSAEQLHAVNKAIEQIPGSDISDVKLGYVPKTTIDLDDEQMESLSTFIDAMDESDDVQEIFTTIAD